MGDALHRLGERRTSRSREDPLEAWRCCVAWPRTLVNKWNGREFAARHGCRLPELYWRGGELSSPPLAALPDRFVIRPVRGMDKRGVLVVSHGTELLNDEPLSSRELRSRLSPVRRLLHPVPLLAEELIESEEGGLPLEVKFHTFGDTVGAIQVVERTGAHSGTFRFYDPAWQPIADPVNTYHPQGKLRESPPPGLETVLAQSAALGKEIGTYVRIDFFAGARGWFFNEFCTVPLLGRRFTPYGDALLGGLWEETVPEAA